MGLHLKGQLDRTMSTNTFAEIVKGMRYAPRFLPLAERLSHSACNRNCANRKPCILCRLTRYFECFLVEGRIFVTKVHSRSATSGKRGINTWTFALTSSLSETFTARPPFPLPSLPLLSLTFYSSFNMVVLIKNNVASVEDVADSSLSPAGRVAQRCTLGCSPATSPSQVIQCSSDLADLPASLPSPHLSSQAPSATSSTGHFSFHFDQYEEWTDEVEARMQNEL
ncbi:hypothetical protein EV363DRAFT_1236027, partial [Boletus edulis]